MKTPSNIHHPQSATLLLAWLLLACSLLPLPMRSSTSTETAINQPASAETQSSDHVLGTAAPTDSPAGQTGATAMPIEGSSSASSGSLEISDSYPLDVASGVMGVSLTASPGKVWVGTGRGTIEKVDSQSGAFEQSISLAGTKIDLESLASDHIVGAVIKMGFDGQYIAATMILNDQIPPHRYLFIIDSDSGAIVHQWDLQSTEWSKEESTNFPDDFGISPGKIWLDGHMIDTQTFEVKKDIPNPGMSHFAYNGNGWMWITGDTGGSCDDLIFIKTDDPDEVVCQSRLPFMIEPNDIYPDVSIMTLAGDRIWMVTGGEGGGQPLTITAYPADMDQLMKETKPLVIVPLMDSSHSVRILFAGNSLWVLWTSGDKRGFLYQLDPQTGATIDSLDLVGDQGRAKGDIPHDFATEGDNLWIVTTFQLLRIKLP